MSGKAIAHLIEGAIPLSAGIYSTLLSYGFLKSTPRQAPLIKFLRWGGPLLIVFGIFQMLGGFIE